MPRMPEDVSLPCTRKEPLRVLHVFFVRQPGRCKHSRRLSGHGCLHRVNRTIVATLGAELHMLVVWRKTGEARGRIGVDPREADAVTVILRRTVRTADCRWATGLMDPTKTASARFGPRSDGCVS